MPAILDVVRHHADEAAGLFTTRQALMNGPHGDIVALRALDFRLAAHLDGLVVAGQESLGRGSSADAGSAGVVFTEAVWSVKTKQSDLFERFVSWCRDIHTFSGAAAALGWLERESLKGTVAGLLRSEDPVTRALGLAATSMHRVDPGLMSKDFVTDVDSRVRARALRAAGEIGCEDAGPACLSAIRDRHPECAFWGAWSAVLLGNRSGALSFLTEAALATIPHRSRAFRVALQVMNVAAAHELLRRLAETPEQLRWLIQGSGVAGDPIYVTWLVGHMADLRTARSAGEAFTLLTGADLGLKGLEGKQPEGFESGPNDDPEDPNVEMDPDDGLPWPDVRKVETWWAANASRFQKGQRYFMGQPVTREHCIDVLKNGYQRQRILAAHYLCLLEPGTPLFNTSAPAWRQQRLLAKMT